MIEVKKIREDLKEIRYYYGKKKQLDMASKATVQCAVLDIVKKYNEKMSIAPVRLYDLYISLYVNNNTQEVVAYDWNCSTDYIKQLNKKLCEFLYNELNKEN